MIANFLHDTELTLKTQGKLKWTMAATDVSNDKQNSEAFGKAFQLVAQGLTEIQMLIQRQEQRVQETVRQHEKKMEESLRQKEKKMEESLRQKEKKMEESLRQKENSLEDALRQQEKKMQEAIREVEEKWKKLYLKHAESTRNLIGTVKQLESKQAICNTRHEALKSEQQKAVEGMNKQLQESLQKHRQHIDESLIGHELQVEQKFQEDLSLQEYTTSEKFDDIRKQIKQSARQQKENMQEALRKQEEKMQAAMTLQEERLEASWMTTKDRLVAADEVVTSLSLKLEEKIDRVEERQGALEHRLIVWDTSIQRVLKAMSPLEGALSSQQEGGTFAGLASTTPIAQQSPESEDRTSQKISKTGAQSSTQASRGLGQDLFEAAKEGKVRDARRLLDAGVAVDVRDGDGWTPLLWAVFNSRADVVSLLLERGADVHARSANRSTALHHAWVDMSGRCAKLLLAAGARVDERDDVGRTPLHFAAMGDNAAAVRALLDAGANNAAKASNGQSPLDMAGVEVVRKILTLPPTNITRTPHGIRKIP